MTDHQDLLQSDGDEISLLDVATAIGEEKRTILGFSATGAIIGLAVALFSTPIFTAKTVILPPQQQASAASAMLSQLGSLAGVAGMAAGIKSPDEQYVAFLKSVRLQNELIDRFKLMARYESKTHEDARKALSNVVQVATDKKTGLITISVDDKDPVFAAQLANAHVPALSRMMGSLALSEAQQRRVFFEKQLEKTQSDLNAAEIDFRQQQQRGGIVATEALAEASVKANATLRAQIAQKEVQLQALRSYATEQNPDVQRVAGELGALRRQLSQLEQGSGGVTSNPTAGMQAVKTFRDVKVLEAKLEVLIRQYEMARLDEAREGPLLQVVDTATPPERKSKPKRALVLVLSTMAAMFIGLVFALGRRAFLQSANAPGTAERIEALRSAWRFR